MKNILLVACLCLVNFGFAQENIDRYNFIEVPDRFEFLSGDNPYQLSDMMVFYIEKKGLKAYKQVDSPNIPKCDALYADLLKAPSAFGTNLTFVLKDCNNNILFQSGKGNSKVKEYKKAYPDALRKAFKTFTNEDFTIALPREMKSVRTEEKQVEQTKPSVEPILKATEVTTEMVSKVPTEEVKEVKPPKLETIVVNEEQLPEAAITNYKRDENVYLLKKVPSGYTLFLVQEGVDNFIKVGELTILEGAIFSMKDIYGEDKSGYFNKNQDLLIELANGNKIVYLKTS